MEIFMDEVGNVQKTGFDGITEEVKVEQAKADLIKEQFGEQEPLILGKFQSQDALVASYTAAEAKITQLAAELAALKGAPPAAPPAGEATPPAAPATGETLPPPAPPATPPAPPATPPTPPATGEPPAITPERQQAIVQNIFAQAGGQDEFAKIADWAGKNLPQERIQMFNDALNAGNEQAALVTLRAIQFDRMMKNGYEPPLLGGSGAAGSGVRPFRSEAELTAAMNDKRYSGIDADEAYIQDVTERLAMSPGIFPGR